MPLSLRNPHSVVAALQTRPQDVIEILLPSHGTAKAGEGWDEVIQLAKRSNIPVRTGRASKGSAKFQKPGRASAFDESQRMGVTEASVKEKSSLSVEELFKNASGRAQGKGLWLALDSLQDTHNVGAIFRAAAFFGVQGILMTQDRSAPLTATVYDVASGGVEFVPFCVQTNLQRAFEIAKDSGMWILGTSEHAHDSFSSIQQDRPWLLVLGNEEKGMRRLTEESCDLLCKIPGSGRVTSLNVSVAAGILISRLSN